MKLYCPPPSGGPTQKAIRVSRFATASDPFGQPMSVTGSLPMLNSISASALGAASRSTRATTAIGAAADARREDGRVADVVGDGIGIMKAPEFGSALRSDGKTSVGIA